jgi:hypothetical protein
VSYLRRNMLTDAQARRIPFRTSEVNEDYISSCLECEKADRKAVIITPKTTGIAAHNRSKAVHRDKHQYGHLPNPSFEETA